MSFRRYPEYKDSGVEWLGRVPAHWEVGPLKRYWTAIDCKHVTAEFVDEGVPVASIREVQGRWVMLDNARRTTEQFYEILTEGGRRPVPGDLIFSRNATVGEVGQVHADHPRFAIGQDVVLLRKCLPEFSSDYFQQVIRATVVTQQLDVLMIGSTFKRINVEEVRALVFPVPPPSDQKAIAVFLDGETAKIDALVAEQERLIDLLKEKRQAVISHAVTKGLNPDAPVKDSGIEWLGKVPAHWSVSKLKHLTPQLTVGIVIEPSKFYVDEGIPALRSLNVKQGTIGLDDLVFISAAGHELHSKSRLRAGDLVAVRSGQPGTTAVVPRELDGCNCIDLIIIRRPTAVSEWFLSWYLASAEASVQFSIGSGGAIQQHFNVSAASELIVTVPPAAEQVDIVAYVVRETGWIDALIAEAQRAIDLLQERRAALISAAVTGQIDVRSAVERPAA